MKYDRDDIVRLVDLAFKGAQADEALKRELNITDSDVEKRCRLLKSGEVLSGLEILFNAIYPQDRSEESPLLQTAKNYPLEYLGISSRPFSALVRREGMRTVADLLVVSEAQIAKIRGVGKDTPTFREICSKRMKFIEDFNNGIIR